MANETHEPRALTAALAAPPFRTRGGGMAMHVADRHVERWAPESNTNRQRSMRSLGFVDRLVAPWIETAQRSASLRLFSQYAKSGVAEREGGAVSWVFPRPWYQDELDWMAAARQVGATSSSEQAPAPTMLTTRGTYVPPSRPSMTAQPAMPSALYEYVAPSLSIANPTQSIAGIGYGGSDAVSRNDAYSPLVSLAAVQAAELMARTVAPMWSTPGTGAPGSAATGGRISPALRGVLTTMLERAATRTAATEVAPTRSSLYAPELVTPPAPRPESSSGQIATAGDIASDGQSASQLADRYAEQRIKIVELQRITRQSAEREIVAQQVAAREVATRETAAVRTETPPVVRVEERAAALRAETELRQRATDRATMTEAQQRQAHVERTAAAEVERTRIEEKIAQRIAERTSSQRLHEQSRSDAASHARAAAIETPVSTATAPAAEMPARRAPAEITAAIAALPPELAAFLAHRPERAMQAITELNDVLRTAELLARSSASNVPFEATRGPRLMMPAGLGGLVAAVDRAHAIADRPAQLAGQLPAAQPMIAAQPRQAVRGDARVPTLPWLVAPTTARAASPSTALGATAATAPVALSHVAWADRWLARFAGATPQSLDVLQAASAGSPHFRMQALAAAAPGEVFVAPIFDTENARAQRTMPVEALTSTETGTMPTRNQTSAVTATTPMPALVRYDDSAETPDDVFLQIAASAANKRAPSTPVASAAATAQAAQQTFGSDRYSMADAVAHAAPSAPGAGLSAQLASSPFASALRHVLPLPSAGSFDVRSLFGAGLSATYLAGLLAPASQEFEIAGTTAPAWASWGTADAVAAPIEREVPTWDATYVSPEADATREDEPVSSPAVAPAATAEAARAAEPLTTLRTALLSWTTSTEAGAQPAFLDAPSTISMGSPTAAITSSAARAMLESMSLPMLSESSATAGERTASWTAPGMMAERAQGWSVAQERSASDLSLDFVTPELVLAARVYGLGPTEAAQAARLAIAGPSHLGAMAGAVDRTFVQAMAIEADRREARAAGQGQGQGATMPGETSPSSSASRAAAITTAYPTSSGEIAAAIDTQAPMRPYVAPGAAFGVERRSPRGAFLWPSGTVAALGLNAASPDGQQSGTVAALELLAAQAVAEIGTYAALGEHPLESAAREEGGSIGSASAAAGAGERPAFAMPTLGATGSTRTAAGEVAAAEPAEADVLGAAAALVPASRRARFDALYVAMSQSPSGRSWSPASRAARALALAGRGDDAPTSAYERAATAWDVLPVVYATDGMSLSAAESTESGTVSTGSSLYASGAARGSARRPGSAGTSGAAGAMDFVEPMISVDRPGLGALSARAGEALGSYVTPASYAPPAATSSGSGGSSSARNDVHSQSPAMRAPSAAQELVRTGRPSGRHGGGEVEIPVWFEQAARKILEDRSGNSDGISMAEMTLVNAAPASHVAASNRTASSAAPLAPSQGSAREPAGEPIDIEKTANDIYREILVLMDAARARNGEPYL